MAKNDRQRSERLPAAVYDLALRLGANPEMNRTTVNLTQTGRMKPSGAAQWMSFSAKQTIATRECAFEWRARAGPLGMVSVCDALKDGEGRLDVLGLGIVPISRAEHSSALMRGELMRYLAELAWAPDAILLNTALRWREDGPDKLAVSVGVGETAAEVTLNLDSEGGSPADLRQTDRARPQRLSCRHHGEAASPTIAATMACGFRLQVKLAGKQTGWKKSTGRAGSSIGTLKTKVVDLRRVRVTSL